MAYRVKITDPAEADIRAAVQRLNEEAPAHALQWYSGLREAIRTLSEMPTRCPFIPEGKGKRRVFRQLLYGKHSGGIYRIIFDIKEKSKEGPLVRVLRVRHGSRDRIKIKDLKAEKTTQQPDEPTRDRPTSTRSKDRDR